MVEPLPDAGGFTRLARERTAELAPGTDHEAMDVVLSVLRLSNRLVGDLEAHVHRPMGWSWAGFRILFTLWVAGPLEPRAQGGERAECLGTRHVVVVIWGSRSSRLAAGASPPGWCRLPPRAQSIRRQRARLRARRSRLQSDG